MRAVRAEGVALNCSFQGWLALTRPHGQCRVMRVVLNEAGTQVVSYEPFVTFLNNQDSPDAVVLGGCCAR